MASSSSQFNPDFSSNDFITDRELAFRALPPMPTRTSPRASSSKTVATRPRTFEGLDWWPGFLDGAANYRNQLDDSIKRHLNPLTYIQSIGGLVPAAKESNVETALEAYVFPYVNGIAKNMTLTFKYTSGGSGRSLSQTDMVILDSSLQSSMNDLSNRVYGCGEVKGPWAWNLAGMSSFMSAVLDDKKSLTMQQVLQQLFGDMVMDEARYGFITNYNDTVFFRRANGKNKVLQISPIVSIRDAPLGKFLYVLAQVEQDESLKPQFSRSVVKITPKEGYKVKITIERHARPNRRATKRCLEAIVHVKPANRRSTRREAGGGSNAVGKVEGTKGKEKVVYEEDDIEHIPIFDMDDLGFTGSVVGFGKYGNVLKGVYNGVKVALKTFDMRHSEAIAAFVREQKAYHELRPIQGACIPILVGVGRLAHMAVPFLALTLEHRFDLKRSLAGRRSEDVRTRIMYALGQIHNLRVHRGDLRFSHLLGSPMNLKFIDFEFSCLHANKEVLDDEKQEMQELLTSGFHIMF